MTRIFCWAIVLLVMLILSSCQTTQESIRTGFNNYYDAWVEDGFLPEEAYLQENETPEIIQTSDLKTKYREIISNWYWCIGCSGFNGPEYETTKIQEALIAFCKEKRAKIAIYSTTYTDTRNGVYSVPYTNYYTHTTTYSAFSYSIKRYDLSSYLFVPIPEEYKILYIPGLSTSNLTQQERDLYKQNTGCFINTVYKNSSAFYANLCYGDIIIAINGKKIFDDDDYMEFVRNSNYGDIWNMTIVRNGFEKEISLIFD